MTKLTRYIESINATTIDHISFANQLNVFASKLNVEQTSSDDVRETALRVIDNSTLPFEQFYIGDAGILWLDISLLTRLASLLSPIILPYMTHWVNIAIHGNTREFAEYTLLNMCESAVMVKVPEPTPLTKATLTDGGDLMLPTLDGYFSQELVSSHTGYSYDTYILLEACKRTGDAAYSINGNETGMSMLQFSAATWDSAYGVVITTYK